MSADPDLDFDVVIETVLRRPEQDLEHLIGKRIRIDRVGTRHYWTTREVVAIVGGYVLTMAHTDHPGQIIGWPHDGTYTFTEETDGRRRP